jgi:hypothetical protein
VGIVGGATNEQWFITSPHPDDGQFCRLQKRQFEQTSNEAHTYLKQLMHSPDPKARHKAIELWLKAGADACGRGGAMTLGGAAAATPPIDPDRLTEAEIAYCGAQLEDARERVDRERAQAGLLPADDYEFFRLWHATLPQILNDQAPPIYFDEHGTAWEPPGATPPAASTPGPLVVGLIVLTTALTLGGPGPVVTPHDPTFVTGAPGPNVVRHQPWLQLCNDSGRTEFAPNLRVRRPSGSVLPARSRTGPTVQAHRAGG